MGVPFVAQLGFAEVDSSGPIVPLTGTADASVQFYKLTQSVNGVITIPNNNKHKKIILDVNGKTISGQFIEEDAYYLTIKTEKEETSQEVIRVFKPYVESYSFKKRKKVKKSKKKEEPKWTH